MNFVQTSKDSVFGGLILPESHVTDIIKNVVAGPGAYSSTRRNNKNVINWETSNGSADADTLFDRQKIASQGRDLERNNPIAGGAINNAATNVIGAGLRARSRINYDYLGISYDDAEKWQKKADFIFHTWASSMDADVSRTQTFYEMQDLIQRNYMVSGDVGVLRRYRRVPGSKLATAIQIIEADRISSPINSLLKNIRAGVELDSDSAPIAYHISKVHPGEIYQRHLNTGMQDWVRVPAFDDSGRRLFLHVFRRTRPDQTRGISYLAPIIEMLKQLGRYSDAEVTAAVVSACFSVFITSDAPTGVNGALSGSIPGLVNGTQVTPKGTGLTQLEPGMIAELAKGESITSVDPNRPNTAFDPFVQALLRQVGMALEQPYETLLKHYTTSFTAARAAMLDLWKFVKVRRSFAVSHFCNPVREWVLTECIIDGLIEAPGFFDDPFAREAWLSCIWSGPSMGHINPSVEADAEMKWIGMGAKSLSESAMENFENEWDDVADQRERELRRYIKLPVLVNPNLVTQPIDPSKQAPGTTMPVPSDGNDTANDPNQDQNNNNGSDDGT